MADTSGDSHLSQKGSGNVNDKSNVPLRHLRKIGVNADGQKNPNGPGGPDTKKMIANNQGKTY